MNTPIALIDEEITTVDGYTFVVVDLTDTEYVVRADRDGQDAAGHPGTEGIDWEYVYIPFTSVG